MRSTPSSAEPPAVDTTPARRRISRSALVALVVLSVALPAGVLALILHGRHPSGATDTNGPLATPAKARVGDVAPDFALAALDGRRVTLSQFRGRPVVLTFFASWCHPCEEDMPILERAQRNRGDRIAVVGVNYQDFPDDTRAFVRRLGVTFPSLLEDSAANPVAARYDVHAMPDTVFIDAQGVVRERLYGQVGRKDLERALNGLLRT